MKGIARFLVLAAIVPLTVMAIDAQAKGVGGKVSGWSGAPTSPSAGSLAGLPAAGFESSGKDKSTVQGYGLPSSSTLGLSGMQITPNGMIAQNTPAMSVATTGSLAGASSVSGSMRGVGNSQVSVLARGVGNSQGSGGTLDIAQMTHFGASGLAAVSSIVGGMGGPNVSSIVSHFMSSSGAAGSGSTPGSGKTSGSATSAAKSQLMGMPTNKACADMTGTKSGCS